MESTNNVLEEAQSLGFLDGTLTVRQLKDAVGKEDTKDYYRFELLDFRNVDLTLDSLGANANLFLGDGQGNLIASSTNQGNAAESIAQILAPGTYHILVRSVRAENNASTTYQLNLQPEELVTGSLTNIWGTSEGIISARHQEHMWVTEDGSWHLMAKLGNGGLSLFSSFDQGASWNYMLSIPDTNNSSTADGLLIGNSIFLISSSATRNVKVSQIDYNPFLQRWNLEQLNSVHEDNNSQASHPTLTMDTENRLWATFTTQNNQNKISTLNLFYSEDEGINWQDSGVTLATADVEERKSGRIITLSNSIVTIYSDGLTLNWAYRLNNWPVDQPWRQGVLFEYENPAQRDPHGTHFSVVVDPLDNIHIATNDGHNRLIYLKYERQENLWHEPRRLTDFRSASYMQISLSEDNRLLIAYDARRSDTYLEVIESSDYGETFSEPTPLVYLPLDNRGNPRVETPGLIGDTLPIIQQIADQSDDIQGLVSFNYQLQEQQENNYDDLVIDVKSSQASSVLDTQGQSHSQGELIDLTEFPHKFITASFEVESNAGFDNRGGLYTVLDEKGTVLDPLSGQIITPGDLNYREVALRNSVVEFTEATGTIEPQLLLGGFFYAPYILADGGQAYFPFPDANPNGIDHLRMLGTDSFAFEDLWGSGDFSDNDVVIEFSLAPWL